VQNRYDIDMANGEKTGGQDPWIWLFIIVILAFLIVSGGGGSFGRGSGIRFGSPSRSGTVEEEIRKAPPPAREPRGARTREEQLASPLAAIPGQPQTTAVKCTFARNLFEGISGNDVKCLQQHLNSQGFTVAPSGAGSPGNETTFYGSRTRTAVSGWQAANGISPAAGYFGPISRAKYNELLGLPPPIPPPPVSATSTYYGKITLSTSRVTATNPNDEYLDLSAKSSNKEKILISGWTLGNSRGERFQIGEGAYLVFSGQVNPQQAIALEPGGRVHIITGRSPIGTSFRVNLCTGYFNQFQMFTPRLQEFCPHPKNESSIQNLQDACLNFLERLRICRQPTNIPTDLSPECKQYLSSKINYSECVAIHKNDVNFFKKEWYAYLNRNAEIWKEKRETITLRDNEGKIVARVSY
jgi:peptidoglycan hydrolase-like protein with peptidoglycan-binding domain